MTWVCQNVRGDPRGTPTKLYGHISKNVDLLLKYAIYAKVIQAHSVLSKKINQNLNTMKKEHIFGCGCV